MERLKRSVKRIQGLGSDTRRCTSLSSKSLSPAAQVMCLINLIHRYWNDLIVLEMRILGKGSIIQGALTGRLIHRLTRR